MKWTSNIFILIIIYLICCAKTCTEEGNITEPKEEELLLVSRDSLKQIFGIDSPVDQLIKALEAAAKQKLADFADYLKIASDSSLDTRFRQEAVEMAGRLFISGEINFRNWNKAYHGLKLYTLEQLLKESLSRELPCWIQPIQINVESPLTWGNDSTFKGNLSFYQQCIPFDSLSSPECLPSMRVIDIYALKKIKFFGEEKLSIWEAFLGDIE